MSEKVTFELSPEEARILLMCLNNERLEFLHTYRRISSLEPALAIFHERLAKHAFLDSGNQFTGISSFEGALKSFVSKTI